MEQQLDWLRIDELNGLLRPINYFSSLVAERKVSWVGWLAAARGALVGRLFFFFFLRRKQKKVNFHLCCCRRRRTALPAFSCGAVELNWNCLLLVFALSLWAEPLGRAGPTNPPKERKTRRQSHPTQPPAFNKRKVKLFF